jgi:transcriptional regulator with XRE-family HTH domain
MSLRERVRDLRKEHGWSQGELVEKIGADPAQISRYEAGRITPSADAVIRLAEVFDVSTDYLLIIDAPRRPLRRGDDALGPASQLSANSAAKTSHSCSASLTPSSLRPGSRHSPTASAEAWQTGRSSVRMLAVLSRVLEPSTL